MFIKRTPLPIILLISATFVFAKCHKDDPPPPPPPSGPTDTTAISKNLLASTTHTSDSGVNTRTFRYDSQNRLVWFSNTSTKANEFEDTSAIVRDAQGIIKQIVYRSDTSRKFPDPALDSVVYTLNYDAATSKYTYKLLQYKSFKVAFKDSTFYKYDAQNRIVTETTNYFDYKTTKTYQPASKSDYTYDANGNLTTINTIYYKVTSTSDYPFQINYTYDTTSVNLLNLGNEAIVVGLPQYYSAHMPATMIGTYPQNPEFNQSLTYNYTYNTKYRPLKANITDAANNNAKSSMAFTYQ